MSELNELLHSAKKVVFLTGAGVSTASGIPDYRSKNGLYSTGGSPEYLLSHPCLINEPEKHYEFVKQYMIHPEAKPNVIHQKMAEFTQKGKADIITQNVDGLHLSAGADPQHLIEFHGDIYHIYCQKCGRTVALEDYLSSMYHENCGGILRTDIVLYEEAIDTGKIEKSVGAISQADLIVVVGTSFVVYPFASLIQYAAPNAKMIAVNRDAITLPSNGKMIKGDAVKEFDQVEV
ncbi:NAD-dependent protein deacylase [Tetragenococcus koreensis]|uniref:NAD-dependent protein deacylase n=1 Tax=Tetragenococcus koreensis TaxID=290335 RepID=UPI001F2E146A|nr:NAD-dependent protein deacylase [Tetragenococcus koreensis]MCF1585550.1 NAD-dependent protein deacylase [Tetragenococcus koreensis]MCF1615096.1 NAD-dependent protein deacylase [Tetragenococcus koreensis]MCF1616982.1 NAD-dependent protein deacylase [Tetragenococcus koreensis]MCF1620141.1 NAD-dependent protein deacylase [Tetragenococcus koreensis]MCF1621924.1 NAD-dependent protein deacylase [Tetragenococcus koreensis]